MDSRALYFRLLAKIPIKCASFSFFDLGYPFSRSTVKSAVKNSLAKKQHFTWSNQHDTTKNQERGKKERVEKKQNTQDKSITIFQ